MANQQHLDLLRQGTTVWNPWKAKKGPGFRPNLSEAHLNGVHLNGADLSEATIGRTTFCDLDLRNVQGLDTLKHVAPSSIGTDTLERSQGNLPDAFLRGAGLSDTFITYARSLVARPIEYYTCFLSYASGDQDFAERLYADLQSKGVRCWFAPEGLKIWEKFWHRNDEYIRLYDKLLLVLSYHSIKRPWVEAEVKMALAKERQRKRLVLFPICLDEAVMKTRQAWRSRLIGDFCGWKEDVRYQEAFTRLLRDLQQSDSPQSKRKPDQR